MIKIQSPPSLQTISKVLPRSSLSPNVTTDSNVHPSVTNHMTYLTYSSAQELIPGAKPPLNN